MKQISSFLFLSFFLGCNSVVDVTPTFTENIGDSDKVKLLGMVVNNITQTSFAIVVSSSNDINENASGTIYYCNETDSPNCDPITGDSKATGRADNKFSVTVNSLSSPYDPGDTLNITFEVIDSDGYLAGTQFDTQITLAP